MEGVAHRLDRRPPLDETASDGIDAGQRSMHAAEHTQTQAQIATQATQERSTARALLIAEYRAKVADAKRNAPKEELAARLAALRIEYLASPTAITATP